MSELLTQLGIDWRLLTAQLVNFLILFFVLKRFLYRPVLEMLEKRRGRIAEGLRDAERSKERLAGIEHERADILHQAEVERASMLERVAGEVDALRRQRSEAAEEEARAIIARAERDAQRVRAELMEEVRRDVGELVLAVSEKVTTETLSKKQHDALITKAIAEWKDVAS